VLIGIADVDQYVPKGSAIDQYAAKETVTLYTGVKNFSMLPEALSTGLTSLLEGAGPRLHGDGIRAGCRRLRDRKLRLFEPHLSSLGERNKAQLAYNSVGAWLGGKAEAPPKGCRVR
jgi:exoribonuclease II